MDRRDYFQIKKQLALIFDEKSQLFKQDKEYKEKLTYRGGGNDHGHSSAGSKPETDFNKVKKQMQLQNSKYIGMAQEPKMVKQMNKESGHGHKCDEQELQA